MEILDPQVLKVQPGYAVLKETRVNQVHQGRLVYQDYLVHRVIRCLMTPLHSLLLWDMVAVKSR